MNATSRRLPRTLLAKLAAAILALPAGGCTIGIDDHPVPPESIPAYAESGSPAAMALPAGGSYSASEPIVSSPLASSSGVRGGTGEPAMVWRTGAQPIVAARAAAPASEAAAETDPVEPEAEAVQAAAEPVTDAVKGEEEREPAEAPEGTARAETPPSFRLAPFVGIDGEEAMPLIQALKARCAAQGIPVNGPSGGLILKGYFSTMPGNGATTITYVWDIYDPSGTRLTRISGEERSKGGNAMPPAAAEAIAGKTAAQLAAWLKNPQA